MAIDDYASGITSDILKACKNGCTKEKIMEQTHLSHDKNYSRDCRQRAIEIY